MKILLTGFEPFGTRSCNTSADLLRYMRLPSFKQAVNSELRKALLPVDFSRTWQRLERKIRIAQPNLIVLMGEGKSSLVTIELRGQNRRQAGALAEPIIKGAPDFFETQVPARAMAAILPYSAATHLAIEEDAGDYLCNFVYYLCLRNFPLIPAVFLHVRPLRREELLQELPRMEAVIHDLLINIVAFRESNLKIY